MKKTTKLKKKTRIPKEWKQIVKSCDHDWEKISMVEGLPEEFMEFHSRKLDWELITIYQELSEKFMRKFSKKISWWYVGRHQKLSEKFIKDFHDRLDMYTVRAYQQHLSKEFLEMC